jgi:hypothetical protein
VSDWSPNGGKRCRAICTTNGVNSRRGAEYQCEEWRTEGDPPLCWTHRKAFSNPDRTVPLRLAEGP